MRNVFNGRVAIVVALGAVFIIAAPTISTATSKFQEVVIRNSATEPVPVAVQGTSQVDASGSTVTLSGTPGVSVVNAPPVPVPFQVVVRESVTDSTSFDCTPVPTPAGFLTRIENVSASVFRNSAEAQPRVFLRAENDRGHASQELVLTDTVGNSQTAIQDTLLFSGPLNGVMHSVSVCLQVTTATGGGGVTTILSGTSTPLS